MEALVGAFNQEKALNRGLLRNCEIFANLRLKLYNEVINPPPVSTVQIANSCYNEPRQMELEREYQKRIKLRRNEPVNVAIYIFN